MNKIINTIALALITTMSFAQVGIGTKTPHPTAILDIDVSSLPANGKKGFLPPRLTTVQRDAIVNPALGLVIYNTSDKCLQFLNSQGWINMCDSSIELLLPTNPATCLPIATRVVEIVSPTTSRIWMDRNLGAYRAASAPNDRYSYGDFYQLGRRTDGHQCRLSEIFNTTTSFTTTQVPAPNTNKFVT